MAIRTTIQVSGGKGPNGKSMAVLVAEKMLKAQGAHVKIGVLSNAPHDPGKRNGAPINMADLAAIHEFGLGNVPERSFLRSGLAQAKDGVKRMLRQIKAPTLANPQALSDALSRIGLYCVAEIQSKFTDGSMPPLAQATIDAKGSDQTLIDTGALRASIQYQVFVPGGATGKDPR